MENWLAAIGLAERIPAFREHRITADQIGDITEDDLRELGLTIGERRRFVRERAKLMAAAPDWLAPVPATAASQAENRPLTVMFADLVDSTAMGERLDPEDLLEVMRIYREFAGQAITRFGGRIARFLGDGILAYFCYPIANENDPERAVRAALDIVRGVAGLQTPNGVELRVRIGLATGRVIVSDLYAAGAADSDTVIGSCPNLAARLQALAGPNEIIIAERTHERIAGRFECEERGVVSLRGFDQPHPTWCVVGEKTTERTGVGGDASSPLSAFVGRKGDLDILSVLWRKALDADGPAALILGEAGIGKSRLVQHFLDQHAQEMPQPICIAASAFDQQSALKPFVDHLRRHAELSPADPPEIATAKLARILAVPDDGRTAAAKVLAGFAGIGDAEAFAEAMSPDELRERTMEILLAHFTSGEAPRCIVIEDLHWLDPTSSAFVEQLVEHVRGRPLLLLITARPDVPTEWTSRVSTTIRLGRLAPEQVSDMIQALIGPRFLGALISQVAERTDGVPLFVEEIARAVLQQQAGRDPRLRNDDLVPASLEESLMARLDRSGVAKQIAQAASVIGRSVRRDVLAALCAVSEAQLEQALATLLRLGIFDRVSSSRPETYTFHHALLRDAAYASLLRDRRRELHAGFARALRAVDPASIELYPEVLAQHLAEAGQVEEATPYWLDAARRNLARSAQMEAIELLRGALAALERAHQTEAVRKLSVQVAVLLGPALIGHKGATDPETQALYTRARELCDNLPDDPAHFPIYWGWWRLSPFSSGRSDRLLERARAWNDPGLELEAHHCAWAVQFQKGAFHNCRSHMNLGLSIYENGDYAHHARLYGNHDAKVCAHGNLAQLCWMEGRLSDAWDSDARSLAWADKLDHIGSRVHAMGLTLLHSVYRRDFALVFERAKKLIDFTVDHSMQDQVAAGQIFQAWVTAMERDPVAGLRELSQAMQRQRQVATNEDLSVYLCLLGDAAIRAGRPEQALEEMLKELPGLESSDLWIWMPDLYRMIGDTLLAANANETDQAEAYYRRAADLVREQDVPMLGLRVAMSHARLDAGRGLHDDAIHRLNEALLAVPERDGSADFIAAARLLDEFHERAG